MPAWEVGAWATDAWLDGSWVGMGAGGAPTTLEDLNTVLIPHLYDTLYDATPTDDINTLLERDIPTVRADAGSQQQDLNTDYAKYLS